jgi:hypothetical protein
MVWSGGTGSAVLVSPAAAVMAAAAIGVGGGPLEHWDRAQPGFVPSCWSEEPVRIAPNRERFSRTDCWSRAPPRTGAQTVHPELMAPGRGWPALVPAPQCGRAIWPSETSWPTPYAGRPKRLSAGKAGGWRWKSGKPLAISRLPPTVGLPASRQGDQGRGERGEIVDHHRGLRGTNEHPVH